MILEVIKQTRDSFVPANLLIGILNFLSNAYSNPELKNLS